MEYDFSTLSILAEVTTAFVAFSTIIASIRVSFGDALSAYQKLLVQFFTVSGMLSVSIALAPMVLWQFQPDVLLVGKYVTWYAMVSSSVYIIYYFRQRMQISAPTPLPSLLVMVGYVIYLSVLGISLTEVYWQPSLAIVTASCFWALCSSVVIFVYFLSTFFDIQR